MVQITSQSFTLSETLTRHRRTGIFILVSVLQLMLLFLRPKNLFLHTLKF